MTFFEICLDEISYDTPYLQVCSEKKSVLKDFFLREISSAAPIPSIGALVGFYHACLGFPIKQTWLDAIKAGNCDTFDGLTYSNAARYCPYANETILGHLAQQRQDVRSTKTKPGRQQPVPL